MCRRIGGRLRQRGSGERKNTAKSSSCTGKEGGSSRKSGDSGNSIAGLKSPKRGKLTRTELEGGKGGGLGEKRGESGSEGRGGIKKSGSNGVGTEGGERTSVMSSGKEGGVLRCSERSRRSGNRRGLKGGKRGGWKRRNRLSVKKSSKTSGAVRIVGEIENEARGGGNRGKWSSRWGSREQWGKGGKGKVRVLWRRRGGGGGGGMGQEIWKKTGRGFNRRRQMRISRTTRAERRKGGRKMKRREGWGRRRGEKRRSRRIEMAEKALVTTSTMAKGDAPLVVATSVSRGAGVAKSSRKGKLGKAGEGWGAAVKGNEAGGLRGTRGGEKGGSGRGGASRDRGKEGGLQGSCGLRRGRGDRSGNRMRGRSGFDRSRNRGRSKIIKKEINKGHRAQGENTQKKEK
jgi:hypothetical protein